MLIKDFKVVRPRFEKSQESILNWITAAHSHKREADFADELKQRLLRLGLGEDKIQTRGYYLEDCNHTNWDQMRIYDIESDPRGSPLDDRMSAFNEAAFDMFERLYPEPSPLPPHLIHTTCTGYVAPSPAQQLTARRGASLTTVTHAYHMGCYAAIPSIRMAMGHCSVEKSATDIVHTELCSLHMNPSCHSTQQLVIQSLFADGCIKYTVDAEGEPGLSVLATLEEMIPGTQEQMTWRPGSWGFQMTISKEVPIIIGRFLGTYLQRLSEKAGGLELSQAYFAIHPGGPKIVEQIASVLQLAPDQISHSLDVLREFGNMSSATLPHIWERMLADRAIPAGEKIVSLAFGPGLCISGALLEKRC